MVIHCEECNYYLGNKCRHFGKTNPGQQYEKIVRGCDTDSTSVNKILKPDSVKADPLWQELFELHKQHVQMVQERKRAIEIQLKAILASDFWDIRGIERPIME
jgi:hypothetical protein